MTITGNQPQSDAEIQQFLAEVFIRMKPVVNDPEGLEIMHGLQSLGYKEVQEVRSGKYLRLSLSAPSKEDAETRVAQMCDQLLANPVIEQYRISIRDTAATG